MSLMQGNTPVNCTCEQEEWLEWCDNAEKLILNCLMHSRSELRLSP
jgi:hypothetical protein